MRNRATAKADSADLYMESREGRIIQFCIQYGVCQKTNPVQKNVAANEELINGVDDQDEVLQIIETIERSKENMELKVKPEGKFLKAFLF